MQKEPKTLDDEIRTLLGAAFFDTHDPSFDKFYQDSFEDGGAEKAQSYTPFLPDKANKFGLLSIGGATGSEAEHVLRNTKINYAVLLEFSSEGAAAARERAKQLEKLKKTLFVVEGDAFQKLDEATGHLKKLRERGKIDGIVCSIQSLLHELRSRSRTHDDKFDFGIFFAKIFDGWNNVQFFGREPCAPGTDDWPENVEFRVRSGKEGFVESKTLCAIANYISGVLCISGSAYALSDGWVTCTSILAVETLFKLLYHNNQGRFRYEMQEQLTSIRPEEIRVALAKGIGTQIGIRYERTVSESFSDRFNALAQVRDQDGLHLPVPNVFVRFFGTKLSRVNGASQKSDGALQKPKSTSKSRVKATPIMPSRKGDLLQIGNREIRLSIDSDVDHDPHRVFNALLDDAKRGEHVSAGWNLRPVPYFSVLHFMYLRFLKTLSSVGIKPRVVIYDLSVIKSNPKDLDRISKSTKIGIAKYLGKDAVITTLSEELKESSGADLFRRLFALARHAGVTANPPSISQSLDLLVSLLVDAKGGSEILICGGQDATPGLRGIKRNLYQAGSVDNPLVLEFPSILDQDEPSVAERPGDLPSERDDLASIIRKLERMKPTEQHTLWAVTAGQRRSGIAPPSQTDKLAKGIYESLSELRNE